MKYLTKEEYEDALNRSFETDEEKEAFQAYAARIHERKEHNTEECRIIGRRNY
jgi:hypothetical protein